MGRCRAVIAAVALCGLAAAAWAATVVAEDWHAQALGPTALPAGWLELPILQRALLKAGALAVVDDHGRRALHVKTQADQHTIIRKRIQVDLRATPILEWHWKVVTFPTGAALRERARSDSPAVLSLAWASPARVVAYAWDASAPVGSRFDNPKQSRVHYNVVRSGVAPRGEWVGERREVAEDYRAIFGESPASGPDEVQISVDSNDTRSVAETLIGAISFVPR